mmetsp:Transcript_38572/g.69030  ORF Transcript_38572/g.69030 Transcript_38572/m.69030 type:complete len:244 (-) Transcript_38572:4348-5079(-)
MSNSLSINTVPEVGVTKKSMFSQTRDTMFFKSSNRYSALYRSSPCKRPSLLPPRPGPDSYSVDDSVIGYIIFSTASRSSAKGPSRIRSAASWNGEKLTSTRTPPTWFRCLQASSRSTGTWGLPKNSSWSALGTPYLKGALKLGRDGTLRVTTPSSAPSPSTTFNTEAVSVALRPRMAMQSRLFRGMATPWLLMRPRVDFRPTTLLRAATTPLEPMLSQVSANEQKPRDTATADPDPAVVRPAA